MNGQKTSRYPYALRWAMIFVALSLSGSVLALPPEQHPSLLYEAEDLPTLRERITRAPYDEWWSTLRSEADEFLTWNPEDVSDQKNRAIDAKILAFVYAMSEEVQYAEKAVEFMRAVTFPPRGGDLGEFHSEAEAAMCYVEAYDMLASYLSGDPVIQEMRQVLYEEGHRLYSEVDPLYDLHRHNKQIRHYSGLGLCALTLSDYEGANSTPQQWHDKAMAEVIPAIEYQVNADGGFAEGPFYHRYSADLYIPYMLALRRITGEDLLTREAVRALHIWSLKIRMPNGQRPNTDDAQVTGFLSGALASVYTDGGLFAWDWTTGGAYTDRHYAVDAICLFDDQIAPEPPSWSPTCFLPEAGDAVLRSDWGPDATYLLLKGEHGDARDLGKSHEHPDATSFLLFARGQILTLDAGYISWPKHDRVNRAENHNLILVDGEGPPLHEFFGNLIGAGVDAYIDSVFSTGFLDYCEVSTAYENVQFRRRVAFPGKTYFLILDELASDAAHRYDWLLHGNGGGTSGGTFERTERGGRWRIGDAELLSYVALPEDITFEEGQEIHSFEYEQELTHTVLKAVHTAADTRYLTVLFPKGSDEADPTFERLLGEGGAGVRVDGEGFSDLMLVRNSDAAYTLLTSQGIGSIRTDAERLFARTDAEGLRALTLWNGRDVEIDGLLHVSAFPELPIRPPVTLSMHLGEDEWNGYVRTEVAAALALHTPSPPTAVYLDEVELPYTYESGKATFTVLNSGALRVSLGRGPLTSITINAEKVRIFRTTNRANIVVAKTEQFSAVGVDSVGNEISIAPTWSVTGDIGTIDPLTGAFTTAKTARRQGEIVASAEGVDAVLRVTTLPDKLSHIAVLPEEATIKVGETASFSTKGTDKFGNDVGRILPAWFVIPGELGQISLVTGRFTPKQTGTGYIVAFAQFKLGYSGMDISSKLLAGTPSGRARITVVADAPGEFDLCGYPNPFNAEMTIQYTLPEHSVVHLSVHNLSGQRIRTLADGERPAGTYSVLWNGTDTSGRTVASGVYLCRIVAGKHNAVRKMLLVK